MEYAHNLSRYYITVQRNLGLALFSSSNQLRSIDKTVANGRMRYLNLISVHFVLFLSLSYKW